MVGFVICFLFGQEENKAKTAPWDADFYLPMFCIAKVFLSIACNGW